ncbi:MAG: tetratricopeptide repeat protein [Rhodospirillaceae bacterium]|nr:tetratricopeptide repeat protein [Rhodospirillaceae bacterium]
MKAPSPGKSVEELIDIGLSHHNASRIQEAFKIYQKVLQISPENPDALHFLGVACHQLHNNDLALQFLERAVPLKPNNSAVFNHYGSVLLTIPNLEMAEHAFRKAIELRPLNAEALFNLGNLIISSHELNHNLEEMEIERTNEAVELLTKATDQQPQQLLWQVKLAQSVVELGDNKKAQDILDQVIKIKPDLAEAYFVRAQTRTQSKDLLKCVILSPTSHRAINNLGFLKLRQGNLKAVVPLFEKATKLAPNDPAVRWGLANGLLATGNLLSGWKEARWRHKKPELFAERTGLPKEWNGEKLQNGKLLVYQEQGIGDELRFASCFDDLTKTVSVPCIVETDARLVPLFSRSFPKIEFIKKLPRSLENITKIDFASVVEKHGLTVHTALGDLPMHLRPSVESFSTNDSYLTPNSSHSDIWRKRLNSLGSAKKIGFCWNTALPHKKYGDYFFSIKELAPIFSLKNFSLVNLQPTECEIELKAAEQEFGVNIYRPEEIDMFNDLDQVSALIKELDFVIGPMTAVISMAGAVGTRCFGLNLHKDWTCLGTNRQPWTPSMTCFYKETANSWRNIMIEITELINSQ